MNQRANECSKLLDFLINVNNGIIPHNVLDDVKTDKEINFKLEDLVGCLDLDNLMMAGHSFGAASALLTLSKRKELKYVFSFFLYVTLRKFYSFLCIFLE